MFYYAVEYFKIFIHLFQKMFLIFLMKFENTIQFVKNLQNFNAFSISISVYPQLLLRYCQDQPKLQNEPKDSR